MSTSPYVALTNVFNPADFEISSDTLTLYDADHRYLKLSGGTINGGLNINNIIIDTSSNMRFPATATTGLTNTLRFGGSISATKMFYDSGINSVAIDGNGNPFNILTVRTSGYNNYSGSVIKVESAGFFNLGLGINANQNTGTLNGTYMSIESYGTDLYFGSSTGHIRMNSNTPKLNLGNNSYTTSNPAALMTMNVLNTGASTGMRFGSDLTIGNSMTMQWFYFGDNNSANRIQFDPYGSSNAFVIQNNKHCGINTTPSYYLDVNGSDTVTIDVGGSGYGQLSKTTTTFTIGPLASQSVTARFSHSILLSSGSYFTTSDFRIKENFEKLDERIINQYIETEPCVWSYKNQKERQVGYIAQDLMKKELNFLINVIENESMEEYIDSDGFKSAAGYQYSVDYTKMVCLLHIKVKELIKRIEELENK